jgi:hypothetical protein
MYCISLRRSEGNQCLYNELLWKSKVAVNAFTPIHGEKVNATNAFEVLSEHAYSKWLDHLIIWALLKDVPIQKKASNAPLRDQKWTMVHCSMHQPKQPTTRQSTTCRAATADWQLVTAIR